MIKVDTKKIKELAEILIVYNLTWLEVRDDNEKILISLEKLQYNIQDTKNMSCKVEENILDKEVKISQNSLISMPVQSSKNQQHADIEVKSPLVGVFHAGLSKDSLPFVSIRSKVKHGDVLCIIEAMKLMNNIIAEQSGEIVDICVKNEDIVEYGQILFMIIHVLQRHKS